MTKGKSEICRTAIKNEVVMKLWAITAGRCELCNRLLYSDLTFGTEGNFGELAHIHAVGASGPRAVRGMSKEDKNRIENLMLLCEEHHHMIDTHPNDYGDNYLINHKSEHERRIRQVTQICAQQSCRIVTYFSNPDHQEVFYSERLFKEAVIYAELFPMQQPVINLNNDSHTMYKPTKASFDEKANDLERQWKNWFDDIVKKEEGIAVFALAPQPLLFKLGSLLSDQNNVHVFQCHRTRSKWAWEDDTTIVEYQVKRTCDNSGSVEALVIDLSAVIDDERIKQVLGSNCSITHITIDNPNRAFVTNKRVQDDFIISFRKAMEFIKNKQPNLTEIHVFMAMPNSLVIRAGMDYMPKADLPVILYEQSSPKEGFFKAIRIGG